MDSYLEMMRRNHGANGNDGVHRQQSFDDFVAMKAIGAKRIQTFGNAWGANASPKCSKQEFVIELLAAGIARTIAELVQHGLAPVFDERMSERLKKAELSFQPTADGKHSLLCFRGEVIRAKNWVQTEAQDLDAIVAKAEA
jgi:hypothetical protein